MDRGTLGHYWKKQREILMIGQTISHYKILSKLGGGGMGMVYEAQDLKLDRPVALKFLSPELTLDPEAKERFIHEAKAASALQHHNICTVHDIDQEDGERLFIVMDCYDGETLKSRIANGKLRIEEATEIAIQIAQGLAKAHEHGIVHRDVKPANIVITKDGIVKILDFGLAKLSTASKLTRTGSTLGTIAYMAPEQLRGGESDARSDVFSLGVVLYEMLTGQLPFRGDHEAALMYSILNEEPEPLQVHIPNAPSALMQVVNRVLDKDPAERYKAMDDLLLDLNRLKKGSGSVGTRLGLARSGRRNRMVVIGVAAGLSIVSGAGWYLNVSTSDKMEFIPGRSVQLTHEPGIELDPALSPDGRMIAYSAFLKGVLRIQVKQVAGGRPIALTSDMTGYQRFPQWSEAGTEINFTSFPSGLQYALPALGGSPRRIGDEIRSPDGTKTVRVLGDRLVMSHNQGAQGAKEVLVFQPHSVSWSPDGSLLACVSGNINYVVGNQLTNIAPSSILVISPIDGATATISDTVSSNVCPTWARDRYVCFVSSQDGTRDIYGARISNSGERDGELRRLTTGLQVHSITLSSDGSALVYALFSRISNIWSVPIPRDGQATSAGATPVTSGNQVIENMDVTADGAWIAFDSDRLGNGDIFKVSPTGGEPIQLTTHKSGDFVPNWSHDGKMIAFHSFREGNRDIFVMQSDGTGLQQVTHDPAQEWYPSWSPDGHHLTFMSDKVPSTDPNVYRMNVFIISCGVDSAGWGSTRQITFDGGTNPHWSPDGRWIAYTQHGVCVIDTSGKEKRLLVEWEAGSTSPMPAHTHWAPDSRHIYYSAINESRQWSWWVVPIDGGTPSLLYTGGEETRGSNPGFATDGRKIYFTRSDYQGDIWKMELTRND